MKIGQRVRIARSDSLQDVIGLEGVIYARGAFIGPNGVTYEYRVRAAGRPLISHAWELEPIIPEGMQPVEWSECLWQPEGESA